QRALEDRLGLAQPGFEVQGLVALAGNDRTSLASRARSLRATFAQCFDAGYGGLTLEPWSGPGSPRALYLTAGELAALWHPATSGVRVRGVVHRRRPESPLPPPAMRARGFLLGVHPQRGREVPVHLPSQDLQAGPLVAAGKTGVGKSTLQHQLARQMALAPG